MLKQFQVFVIFVLFYICAGLPTATQTTGKVVDQYSSIANPTMWAAKQNSWYHLIDTEMRRALQTTVSRNPEDDYLSDNGEIRTATGGFIYTLMVMLTIVAFISNGVFLVYVFWLSK
jgi:hypothetical protein